MPLQLFIGIMSGTSLDGVDAVVADFAHLPRCKVLGSAHVPFSPNLRLRVARLQHPDADELHESALAANELADHYANACELALADAKVPRHAIAAIGCHGQTVRHRPELGYSLQLNNAARLAELTGMPIIADFRSRDIAAGGQGAPLVPAFHAAILRTPRRYRVVVNIGGMANITALPTKGDNFGFDCGPGNVLMDAWSERHRSEPFDANGTWATSGKVIDALLQRLLAEPYFDRPPPKSTGRDLFNESWLLKQLDGVYRAQDVQATLLELTGRTIADAIKRHCGAAQEVIVCGGGAYNGALRSALSRLVPSIPVVPTDQYGIPARGVEALAFAWLALQTLNSAPANLPSATGAKGPRVLGAIYPA